MAITRTERFVIAMILALICAGVSLIIAQAQGPQPAAPVVQATSDCKTCHEDFYQQWQMGSHGQATIDQVFVDEWAKQGKPGACLVCHTTGYDATTGEYQAEGVSCQACHSPIPANHPTDNMPVDKSTDLCGRCHSNTQFALPNWQMSAHYQRNISCSVCHDPHATSLRAVAGQNIADDPSALCMNCHKDYAADFTHSSHGEAGITCVNCHMKADKSTSTFETAHKLPDHSFSPTLDTCSSCHARQMHSASDANAAQHTAENAAINPELNNVQPVAEEPQPVSPIGFAGVAGLLGLAAGMVFAPWLERTYDRINKHGG